MWLQTCQLRSLRLRMFWLRLIIQLADYSAKTSESSVSDFRCLSEENLGRFQTMRKECRVKTFDGDPFLYLSNDQFWVQYDRDWQDWDVESLWNCWDEFDWRVHWRSSFCMCHWWSELWACHRFSSWDWFGRPPNNDEEAMPSDLEERKEVIPQELGSDSSGWRWEKSSPYVNGSRLTFLAGQYWKVLVILMIHTGMLGLVVITGDRENDIKSEVSVLNEIGVGGLNIECKAFACKKITQRLDMSRSPTYVLGHYKTIDYKTHPLRDVSRKKSDKAGFINWRMASMLLRRNSQQS